MSMIYRLFSVLLVVAGLVSGAQASERSFEFSVVSQNECRDLEAKLVQGERAVESKLALPAGTLSVATRLHRVRSCSGAGRDHMCDFDLYCRTTLASADSTLSFSWFETTVREGSSRDSLCHADHVDALAKRNVLMADQVNRRKYGGMIGPKQCFTEGLEVTR